MSTFINLNESKLMDYYEKMMDEVYIKYFTFPSDIPYIPIGEEDRSDMSYYEAMGRGLADAAGVGGYKPLSGKDPDNLMGLTDKAFISQYGIDAFRKIEKKRVKFIRDERYCNGLPRRGGAASVARQNVNEGLSCFFVMVVAVVTLAITVWIANFMNQLGAW